ncbi:MAG TPA: hypothetical protein PLP56_02135 [Candidatus Omnitrophota bacterium]|nr:hypothetical protein [Candidatus Omnitrophota bacterium]HNQ49928.1 hypothetical protein [Candidatus Omnitrophota bacterium]HQO37320.1 hypothetical protein [Candidatus Omnitrophota bacterium]HQQ05765.1 hypothetical protein [Candidatus Omnitrophota bacterium]
MIVPMKKIGVICQQKDSVDTVRRLRALGVVHAAHVRPPQGGDIASLQADIGLATAALDVLARGQETAPVPAEPRKHFDGWKTTARHIVDLDKRLDQLAEFSRGLKAGIEAWDPWGDFDPAQIESLSRRGIFVRLFRIPEKELGAIASTAIVKTVSVLAGIANCVVVSRHKEELPFQEVALPKSSLSAMRSKSEKDAVLEMTLRAELAGLRQQAKPLQEQKALLEKELVFQQAVCGMGQHGMLAYLSGYAPFDSMDALELVAREHQWALSVSDPGPEEAVPTLLRNPAWVDRIKPVFGLLGIVPGYRELDVSMIFLIFFCIFFGILIGDAGYGIMYLALTAWLHYKNRRNAAIAHVFSLLYILSLCAVVWGVMTGTFFGQEWLKNRGFAPLVPELNDVKIMQTFCFFLGAFHLSLAHAWRGVLKLPSLSALADAGWICVLWTAFFLARTLILSDPFPSWGIDLAGAGVALVVFFTNPQRNIFKAVAAGLGTVALSLMNNFTDVVSYVRLFAVGLATVAIAETTNTMAAGLGAGSGAIIAGVIIAGIGHALNIVLGPMSVLVHGVRLNVLEFSSHANVSWSGFAYEPLKE